MTDVLDPPHPPRLARHLATPVPDVLYHYTDQHGLLGIVRSGELWATSWDCLNDSEEALVLLNVLKVRVSARLSNATDEKEKLALNSVLSRASRFSPLACDYGISSWSAARDDLSQWRAYSGDGTGYSIGMKGAALKAIAEQQGGMLIPCIYDQSEQEAIVDELIEYAIAAGWDWDEIYLGNLLVYLLRYSAIFKPASFSAEREWRIVTDRIMYETACFRPGKSNLRTYLPVSIESIVRPGKDGIGIAEILIGPCPSQNMAGQKVDYLLRKYCDRDKTIRTPNSKVPYRNW
jgi:hypothetical protein